MKISSLQKGLVGHWTMSQDSLKGSLLADKTPYENDGTIYGATFTTDRKGQANKAMSFDGNDYIDCGNDESLNFGTGDFSTSLWVKSNGHEDKGSKFNMILSKGAIVDDGHIPGYAISIYKDDKPLFQVNNAENTCAKGDNMINDGLYHHLVGVKNGTNLKLYVDNVLSNIQGTQNNSCSNIDIFLIGKSLYSNREFNGSIDDVRIYNRALSQEEITLLYNSYNPILRI